MKRVTLLTVMSTLSVVLFSFHLTDDALHAAPGSWEAGPGHLVGALILFVWLYATLMLADRRWGLALILLLSLVGAAVPAIHLLHAPRVVDGVIVAPDRSWAFMWTLCALQVSALFAVVLSARELWRGGR